MVTLFNVHPDALVARVNAVVARHVSKWLERRPSIGDVQCECAEPDLVWVELGHIRVMPADFDAGELYVRCDGLDDFSDDAPATFVACKSCNRVFKPLNVGRVNFF